MFGVAMLAVAFFATEPVSLHGVLALTVAAVCVALLAGVHPQPLPPARARLTEPAAERVIYLRHSDPDAAGRPRPRAPGLG